MAGMMDKMGAPDSGMAMSDEPDADETGGAPDADLDDFGHAISEAFPDNDWTPEKLDAMKEAIRICLEKDEAGGYKGGSDMEKPGGLALVFGGEGKKKG